MGHGHGHGHGLHSPSLVSRHHTQSPAVQHNHAHSHLPVHRRETRGKQLNANLSLSERKRAVTVHVCCMFDIRPRGGRTLTELLHDKARETSARVQPADARCGMLIERRNIERRLIERRNIERRLVHDDR